jgi:hypothetical protein
VAVRADKQEPQRGGVADGVAGAALEELRPLALEARKDRRVTLETCLCADLGLVREAEQRPSLVGLRPQARDQLV